MKEGEREEDWKRYGEREGEKKRGKEGGDVYLFPFLSLSLPFFTHLFFFYAASLDSFHISISFLFFRSPIFFLELVETFREAI